MKIILERNVPNSYFKVKLAVNQDGCSL